MMKSTYLTVVFTLLTIKNKFIFRLLIINPYTITLSQAAPAAFLLFELLN